MASPSDVTVVPWYREEAYSQVLAVMEDAATLPDRFEWWQRGAAEQVAVLRRKGAMLAEIPIDPTLFLTWCSEHDLLPNAEARIDYAHELAAHRVHA